MLFSTNKNDVNEDYTEIPSRAIRDFNNADEKRFHISCQDVYIYLLKSKGKKKKRTVNICEDSGKILKRDVTRQYYRLRAYYKTIAKNTGYNIRTVNDAISHLKNRGTINVITNFSENFIEYTSFQGKLDAFSEKLLLDDDEIDDYDEDTYKPKVRRKQFIEIPYSSKFIKISNHFLDYILSIKQLVKRNLLWYLIIAELKGSEAISLRRISKHKNWDRGNLIDAKKSLVKDGVIIVKERYTDNGRRLSDEIKFNHEWLAYKSNIYFYENQMAINQLQYEYAARI